MHKYISHHLTGKIIKQRVLNNNPVPSDIRQEEPVAGRGLLASGGNLDFCDPSSNHGEHIHFFFSIWVFFHAHSRFTGQQGKGEAIYLTPHYHFHLLHRHLDISRAITAESSLLHIASSRTRTGNLWFPSTSC